jgi:hypothetical protein
MSSPYFRFTNGALRMRGVQYVEPVRVFPPTSVTVPVIEPTPAPVSTPEPLPEPTPAPVSTPEPVQVAEVPVVEPVPEPSEVEAPAEVLEAPAESGLVPEDPPA